VLFEALPASAPGKWVAGVVALTTFALLLLTGAHVRREAMAEGYG
jgi:hypothetical protein